ncbi:hypothetical protein TD95_004292 [Thielaviopsis punctulata]|uniref:HECT-type E3 ubiquitin transferase n=1 Tax=Thielaviopsis punctulata TaxID=72032 RepID=A0A0F4ZHB7_9PEZI|nr:hypothetical protein TD95_004292 [Thielaviopsis punctulata]
MSDDSQDLAAGPSSSSQQHKESDLSSDQDAAMTGTEDLALEHQDSQHSSDDDEADDEHDHDHGHRYDDEDEDPFSEYGTSHISDTLRAFHGMMHGMPSRMRSILESLRSGDVNIQYTALQDLSEILLVSTEDNLQGQISTDLLVKELLNLMQPENTPEIMLVACRCLANLMEALPTSVGNVVYLGAVPILCSKLLEISFIDVAEQSLSTLEKISREFPAAIVREGGLTACLSYLDFFATSTQRTAVTIAANCCRNIPEDSFPVVRDCMPKLLDVLSSSDQRVVEQASLCVCGIVESLKYHPSKLEDFVNVDLLRAVLRLLVPGTTNLISSSIHTQFLRVLAHTARASPQLSADLFRLNVVETLYQMLTGVAPPSGTDDIASKLDSVIIMQALIHRPREQVMETLNVICELLPSESTNNFEISQNQFFITDRSVLKANNEKRIKLLKDCVPEVRRFAMILFPTLTDAFSSTVNLDVRRRVMTAHLKMLSNLDKPILLEALSVVSYASFLAAIFSQKDHHVLISMALQCSELLLSRLGDVYRYQLYREGVIAEITKLAHDDAVEVEELNEKPAADSEIASDDESDEPETHDEDVTSDQDDDAVIADAMYSDNESLEEEGLDYEDRDGHDDENVEHNESEDDEESGSESSGSHDSDSDDGPCHVARNVVSAQSQIKAAAKKFLENHETEKQSKQMKKKALKILTTLSELSESLEAYFLHRNAPDMSPEAGKALFTRLAGYFDADVLDSVTSAEILASGLIKVLLDIFGNPDENLARAAQATFLESFMGTSSKLKGKAGIADSPQTAFSSMIHKLQDVLSRSEHFDVTTIQQSPYEGSRGNSASFLAKQIKLKLVADEDSNVPRAYRSLMVSIHAIASFQSLADYLRPRISITPVSELDGISHTGRFAALSQALAAINNTGALSPADAQRLAAQLGAFNSHRAGSTSESYSRRHKWPEPEAPTTPGSNSGTRKSHNRNDATGTPSAKSSSEDESMNESAECENDKQDSDEEEDDPAPNALEALLNEFEGRHHSSSGHTSGSNDSDKNASDTKVSTPTKSPKAQSKASASKASSGSPAPSSKRARKTSLQTAAKGKSKSPKSDDSPTSNEWHIEFLIDGKVIPSDHTVFRTIYNFQNNDENNGRHVWTNVHQIKYRKVLGSATPRASSQPPSADSPEGSSSDGIPSSLTQHPITASVLRLLRILHDLNANIEDVMAENSEIVRLNVEPLTQFVNTKLTAKLNRQLEEPLVVASNCLPNWVEDLARCYPFLFPFETRHLFLQSTSFGYARSMTRWQSGQGNDDRRARDERQFLGRLQRQKVRIGRSKMFESALKVMNLYGSGQSILEVEYFEEVGTGLGPTLEFYATISREFAKKKLKLWRDIDTSEDELYVTGPTGLFPRPMTKAQLSSSNGTRILHLFTMLGKFVARSMLDSRLIDIHLNPIFFRIGDGSMSGIRPSLGAIKSVDPALARSLKMIKKFVVAKKEIDDDSSLTPEEKTAMYDSVMVDGCSIDDLCLDFTLPGYPNIDLLHRGAQKRVTMANVDKYLDLVIDMTLGSGVRRQIDAFRAGFTTVFPYTALNAFTPDELVSLFGRVDEDWSLETLMDSIKADHGFNMDSRSVKNLLQVMSTLSDTERRDFLQFTTGSPKLPIGGFRSLKPMFTVVCRPSEAPNTPDDYLPSVMTCVNYLKLPDYSDLETMRKRLMTAIKEGQGAFHLS